MTIPKASEPATERQLEYFQMLAKVVIKKGGPVPELTGTETREEISSMIDGLRESYQPGEGSDPSDAQLKYISGLNESARKKGLRPIDRQPDNKRDASAIIQELKGRIAPEDMTERQATCASPEGQRILERLRAVYRRGNGREKNILTGIARNVKIRVNKDWTPLIAEKEVWFLKEMEAEPEVEPPVDLLALKNEPDPEDD